MNSNSRLYNCARCHCQVIICSRCDFGNQYCGERCAKPARVASLRRAGGKYRSSRRGRFKNAERQRRFRELQRQKVTYQGSAPTTNDALLPSEPVRLKREQSQAGIHGQSTRHCHFCQQDCGDFLRLHFLHPPPRSRR